VNIALISFEYPIDTAWGGIATYVQQAARMLHNAGHYIEVFAGGKTEDRVEFDEGVRVNLVSYDKRMKFYNDVEPVFSERHKETKFDVLEVPEFATDAKRITEKHPEVAVVVKTHSPYFLNKELNTSEWPLKRKLRHVAGSLKRGERPILPLFYNFRKDEEYLEAKKADIISAPSRSLQQIVKNKWNLPDEKFIRVPLPFLPSESMRSISPPGNSLTKAGFVGRLETRKGVSILAKSLKKILSNHPDLFFYWIGQSQKAPDGQILMVDYLRETLSEFGDRVIFTGKVDYDELPSYLEKLDVCVFPSIWENFPNVCLEAMSAARAVIGSEAGGMADMITHKKNGYLVPPKDSGAIIEAFEYFYDNPDMLHEFGRLARDTILTNYAPEVIARQQLAMYDKAIEIRRNKDKPAIE